MKSKCNTIQLERMNLIILEIDLFLSAMAQHELCQSKED